MSVTTLLMRLFNNSRVIARSVSDKAIPYGLTLLRGACPERQEILRYAQNDTKRRARNDKHAAVKRPSNKNKSVGVWYVVTTLEREVNRKTAVFPEQAAYFLASSAAGKVPSASSWSISVRKITKMG